MPHSRLWLCSIAVAASGACRSRFPGCGAEVESARSECGCRSRFKALTRLRSAVVYEDPSSTRCTVSSTRVGRGWPSRSRFSWPSVLLWKGWRRPGGGRYRFTALA